MTPLLQFNPNTFWAQGGSSDTLNKWWIWAIAALLIVIIGIAIGQSARKAPAPKGGFSKRNWRRAARAFGLDESEIRFLEGHAKALGVTDADATFRDKAKLEAFFKAAYRHIEKNSESESTADELKARLFEVRERHARRGARGTPVRSSRQLGRNFPISFITPEDENYPTVVVLSEQRGLYVEPILDPLGRPIRFRRGTKLSCSFYSESHQGYQFATRVLGFQKSGDRELMILEHSETVTALPSRQHQRRESRVPCVYYHVEVDAKDSRGRSETKGKVKNISFSGTVFDISAGGIAIKGTTTFSPGDYVKVVLDPGSGELSAFGKVLRLNKSRVSGGIMHIKFVKISRKSLNAILSYVHGYSD